MKPTEELEDGEYRLLEVDNRLLVPINKKIRVIITSGDVIHS
jgi:heme/copper-type cytochrome/quinol oxidase subunit 2